MHNFFFKKVFHSSCWFPLISPYIWIHINSLHLLFFHLTTSFLVWLIDFSTRSRLEIKWIMGIMKNPLLIIIIFLCVMIPWDMISLNFSKVITIFSYFQIFSIFQFNSIFNFCSIVEISQKFRLQEIFIKITRIFNLMNELKKPMITNDWFCREKTKMVLF